MRLLKVISWFLKAEHVQLCWNEFCLFMLNICTAEELCFARSDLNKGCKRTSINYLVKGEFYSPSPFFSIRCL